MKLNWLGNRKAISAAFVVAMGVLALIFASTYRSTLVLTEAVESRQQSHKVLQQVQRLLRVLDDAETGQRGYLLTGEESYLAPYQAGIQKVEITTKDLDGLIGKDNDQKPDVAALHLLITSKLTELQRTIKLRRDAGFEAARQVVLTDAGKDAMDAIRTMIRRMTDREEESFNTDQKVITTSGRTSIRVVLLGGAVSFVLLFSTFFLLQKEISVRTLAEEGIQRLNRDLERRSLELEAANKELEAFTYSVSHDLRAPLRHIDGFSNMLVETHGAELSDEAREFVGLIRESTKEMGQLVDDLLNLARVGRKELVLQVTGLSTLVDEVVADLKTANPARAIEWNLKELPFVECDPGLVRQVFVNLLSNAIKFTRPRQKADIEVGASERAGEQVIFVKDNGVGFSMKSSAKLFGVFQRLHRQEDFEGTGVGLATVQRIINKHGGRVWVEAELNQGATFFFTLATTGKRLEKKDVFEGVQI